MKKNLLLLTLFSVVFGFAQTNSDTCALANDAAPITGPGSYSVDAINGSQIPDPSCVGNDVNVTAGEWFKYIPSEDTYMTITTDLNENVPGDTRLHIYSVR